MAQSDPLDILLAHSHWATRQILLACAAITPEQFHRRFEMGPGSLAATTTHIVAATRRWLDLLAGREQRPSIDNDGTQRSPAQLLLLFDEAASELAAVARSKPLDSTLIATRVSETFAFTRGAVLTHVTTHAMHHRAQCLNMLRHVGVSPLPPSSVLQWMIKEGTAPEAATASAPLSR